MSKIRYYIGNLFLCFTIIDNVVDEIEIAAEPAGDLGGSANAFSLRYTAGSQDMTEIFAALTRNDFIVPLNKSAQNKINSIMKGIEGKQ